MTGNSGPAQDALAREWPEIDTTAAHPARIWDFWAGGHGSFPADQEAAREIAAAGPGIVPAVRASRAFLGRAVRHLAGDAGVRQFLDIGTGLPTGGNTPDTAQREAPDSRIVCADHDPAVLAQAQRLLRSTPEGECAYIFADLRDPDGIWQQAAATLDTGQPVAVLLMAVLQHVRDGDDPHALAARVMAPLPPGSYLVISHPASDLGGQLSWDWEASGSAGGRSAVTPRDRGEVERFFARLDLLEPGVVQPPQWRPAPAGDAPAGPVPMWCGVARKP